MGTTLRAAIMLLALVGGPCAWMYYGPLPAGGQRVVDQLVGVAKDAINWRPSSPADAPLAAAETAPEEGHASSEGTTAPPFAAGPPTFEQRVAPLLGELKRLGAVAYDLEPWGAEGQMYRFRCEMRLTATSHATQQFEAVSADPRTSMEQVAGQVASWQATRPAALQ